MIWCNYFELRFESTNDTVRIIIDPFTMWEGFLNRWHISAIILNGCSFKGWNFYPIRAARTPVMSTRQSADLKDTEHSSIPPLSDEVWVMRYESWDTLQKVFCAKSSDFTRDQLKLVPWCVCTGFSWKCAWYIIQFDWMILTFEPSSWDALDWSSFQSIFYIGHFIAQSSRSTCNIQRITMSHETVTRMVKYSHKMIDTIAKEVEDHFIPRKEFLIM